MSEPSKYANAAEGLEIALEPSAEVWYQKRLAINPRDKGDKAWEKEEKDFIVKFWVEKWNDRMNPAVVRINGRHYLIGDEESRGERGFGGVRYHIKFNDGRDIVTTNLWSQGEIPEEVRELWLSDNAEFIED